MLPQNLIDLIKEDLIRHEGYVAEIYLDSEHLPTFGIGHLVTEADPEFTWPVGSPVTDERILDVFHIDCNAACEDACALFLNFSSHPENVQRVLVNMAFNLGRNRLSKFKNMITAVNEGNYSKAADEMVDSKWYRQVKRRGEELVEIMRGS
jgi:GH24 family phage-related lysozyme (muramidase)